MRYLKKIELDNIYSNQVLEALGDDPGFKNDEVTWCNRTHNELLLLTKNEEDIFIAYIEKAKEWYFYGFQYDDKFKICFRFKSRKFKSI